MTEDNLKFLYKEMNFDAVVDSRGCEYTGCTAPTGKIIVIQSDVWQFCFEHFGKVINAFITQFKKEN